MATFESISVPIIIGNGSTGSTDPDGGVIECPYEAQFFSVATGIGTFINTQTGATANITQDCCVGFGLYWNDDNDKCYNAPPDDNDSEPPIPDGTIGSDEGVDDDDNVITGGVGGNGWGHGGGVQVLDDLFHHDIKGTKNKVVTLDGIIIKGDKNIIDEGGKRISIYGDENEVGINHYSTTQI